MTNFKELGKVLPSDGVDLTVMPNAMEHAEIVRDKKEGGASANDGYTSQTKAGGKAKS